VDKEGNPLHNAIVWQDRRTTDECDYIEKIVGSDKIYQKTGLTIDPYFSGSKILWFKNEKPKIYQKTHKFLLVHDYILHKLTGKYCTDYSNASRTMLFNINDLNWSDSIATELELDLDKMPEAMESGKEVGNIISSDIGFSTKTKVITGGGDQQCAALGVGVVKPGRMKCTTGTGSFILGYLDEPTFDPEKKVLCSCHAVPGKWVQEASIFTTGAVLRWARDKLGIGEKVEALLKESRSESCDPYDLMTERASKAKVGSNGLLTMPHFIGAGAPHWNPHARGVIFGLELGTKTGEIYRSILEGVAMEVKKNVLTFKNLGMEPKEMRVTGGGSRSELWNQIMADVVNIQCGRGELEESTAVGAAILATYGAGEFSDISNAADEMANITHKWTPQQENVEIYNRLFKLNEKLYDTLNEANIYDDLIKFQK